MADSSGDLEQAMNEEQIKFLPQKKGSLQKNACNGYSFEALLSREDLIRIDREEPKWRRTRIILLVVFWVVWIALLAASIVIIVLTPKCPPTPKLTFWQAKTGYWVDPFAFRDSDGDSIGDFKGLTERLDYIKNAVGAGFILLGSFVSGTFSADNTRLGLVSDFYSVDEALGTIEDFRSFVKNSHRNGLEVVATLDLNSVSTSHKWTREPHFLQKILESAVSRDGGEASVTINGLQFYSVLGNKTVDLNLSSDIVVAELQKVVEYWLNEGLDGILLGGAAFYVEDGLPVSNEITTVTSNNKWFKKYPSRQLFTNQTVKFISKIRESVDGISKLTSRPRLLAVDAGDYGYGLSVELDESIRFLGEPEYPAAHMVISRQFVKNRGWKALVSGDLSNSSIASYDVVSGGHKDRFALSTATPSDQRHSDIVSLAATFLLPGTPLIYYGTELAIQPTELLTSPPTMYPKGKVPFPNLDRLDSSVSSHLPMPWDRSGLGFSAAPIGGSFSQYLKEFNITETVESAMSFGRGTTSFQLVQSLIQLRKKPNMLWGNFSQTKLDSHVAGKNLEIFTRQATGYPASIVAVIRETHYGGVFNFNSVCSHVVPTFVYPLNKDIVIDQAIDSSRIYLKTETKPAVYVFDCV